MKNIFFILLLFSSIAYSKENVNILSYYGVNNTIDGQPMVDMINKLRFYPVFSYREHTDSVKITIYYGNEVYQRSAIRHQEGLYWEALLPQFTIGEAIQRYEVECAIDLQSQEISDKISDLSKFSKGYSKKISSFLNLGESINSTIESWNSLALDDQAKELKKYNDSIITKNQTNKAIYKAITDSIHLLTTKVKNLQEYDVFRNVAISQVNQVENAPKLIKLQRDLTDCTIMYTNLNGYIQQTLSEIDTSESEQYETAYDVLKATGDSLTNLSQQIIQLLNFQNKIQDLSSNIDSILQREFIVKKELRKYLTIQLQDTSSFGISIKPSDIIINDKLTYAKVLYRNYKYSNRTMPALDPAERLSIFRIRYIPFPIVNGELLGPSRKNIPIVFEIGLTFGNVLISSNEILKPVFSPNNFGVSIALTPSFFKEDTKILALALTYDFNVYASLAVGVNFGSGTREYEKDSPIPPQTYFSVGINQKAFQLLMKGVKNTFSKN